MMLRCSILLTIRAIAVLCLLASVAPADSVYLGIDGRGAVQFDGKRIRQLFASPHIVLYIAQGSPGVMWIGSTVKVQRYENGKLDEGILEVPLHLRVSPAGTPWIGNQKEVSWFDGQRRTLALPRTKAEPLNDLEIDATGRVWIQFGDTLQYTTGRSWTTFVGPPGQQLASCKLAVRGDLFLACWQAIYRLANNTWSLVAKLDKVVAEDFEVGADGTLYVVAFEKMHVVKPGADPLVFDLPNWHLRAFAVDERGRMWFGGDSGLRVYDATGKQLKLPRAIPTKQEVLAILVDSNGADL
jgi:ligand-binding sensor domain-containing protein